VLQLSVFKIVVCSISYLLQMHHLSIEGNMTMSTIALKVGVSANQQDTMSALNTVEGLAKWWTNETTGSSEVGGTIHFRFGGEGPDMKVVKSTDDTVVWECLSGHPEWPGTELEFIVKQEEETVIYFQHRGWPGVTPMYQHCTTKWAAFLFSLKAYLDGETARAFPNDIKVSTLGY